MQIPADHPQRLELNDEVHARPPEALRPPMRLSYLAMFVAPGDRDLEWRALTDLAGRYGASQPVRGASHYSGDFDSFRLKWERHGEFTRYVIMVAGGAEKAFSSPAILAVPPDWIANLPGTTLVATNIALVAGTDAIPNPDDLAARLFGGNVLVGSIAGGGMARAFTDFRIHEGGFGRLYVEDLGLTPRQAGRTVQRLLEIDTYRLLALLALPVAREVSPRLNAGEHELAEIAAAMIGASEDDEPVLLSRLTKLAAEIDARLAATHFRFGAARAYYGLVQRRIAELREDRIAGLQTFGEFTERRLAPAMNTCEAIADRLKSLSERVARATSLLSTRVDLTRERQNQALLEQMNRRAQMQLRLQETVEGLSVAAITYYVVGLVASAAKGAKAAGYSVEPDLVAGLSIPIVALIVLFGLRRLRAMLLGSGSDASEA